MAATAVSAAPVETTAALSLERRSNLGSAQSWADATGEMDFSFHPFTGKPFNVLELLDGDNLSTEPTGDSHDQDSNQSTEPLSDVATLADPDASAAKKKKKKPKKKNTKEGADDGENRPLSTLYEPWVDAEDDVAFDLEVFADLPKRLLIRAKSIKADTDTLFEQNFLQEFAEHYRQPLYTEQSFREEYIKGLATHESMKFKLSFFAAPLNSLLQALKNIGEAFTASTDELKAYVVKNVFHNPKFKELVNDKKSQLSVTQLNSILETFSADTEFNNIVKVVAGSSSKIAYYCYLLSLANAYTKEFLQKSVPVKDRQTYQDNIDVLRKWGKAVIDVTLDHYKGVEWVNSVVYWDKLIKRKDFN
ncbi:hypothetical protein H4R35_000555 [Dimargaris xerosporica]|nr:hypothetical protein H4R35_000555 [Dimargaris xerosporica]